jgi:hypothetical protein
MKHVVEVVIQACVLTHAMTAAHITRGSQVHSLIAIYFTQPKQYFHPAHNSPC